MLSLVTDCRAVDDVVREAEPVPVLGRELAAASGEGASVPDCWRRANAGGWTSIAGIGPRLSIAKLHSKLKRRLLYRRIRHSLLGSLVF